MLLDDSLSASVYSVESDEADTSDVPPFICSAAIADPYVLLHLSNNSAVLLKADAATGKLERVAVSFGATDITSLSLFEDMNSAWLSTWGARTGLTGAPMEDVAASSGAVKDEPGTGKSEEAAPAAGAASSAADVELDDEEMG